MAIPTGMVRGRRKLSAETPRTAADWEDAALSVIASHGLAALAIPDLARSLGVTKGSFYWHFRGIDELIDRALQRWEEMDRAILDEVRRNEDARIRLRALFEQAMEKRDAHALYMALASLADPEVGHVVRRISDRRVRFLVEAYEDLGLPGSAARERALLAYTAYVGTLNLRKQNWPGLRTRKQVAEYIKHAIDTLIP